MNWKSTDCILNSRSFWSSKHTSVCELQYEANELPNKKKHALNILLSEFRIIMEFSMIFFQFPQSFRTTDSNFLNIWLNLTMTTHDNHHAMPSPEVSALVARELIHWAKADEVQAGNSLDRGVSTDINQWYIMIPIINFIYICLLVYLCVCPLWSNIYIIVMIYV